MQAATYPARFGDQSPRRRAISLVLTVAAHLLIVWLLLRLGPAVISPPPAQSPLSTFSVLPDPAARAASATTKRIARAKPAAGGAAPQPRAAPVAPDRPVAPPVPPFPAMLPGGSQLFEAADISKIPSARTGEGEGSGEGSAKGAGRDSVATYGPGEGPGGQRLYNAELVRAPTGPELAFYLKATPPADSWGEIACRMTPDLSLENCRVLSESPVGSGLARALRQAAWQFKIRPPRIERTAMTNTWVRIHIDWNRTSKE